MLARLFPASLQLGRLQESQASSESQKATQYTYKNDRDLVVLTTADSYLLVIADAATVDSIRAQVHTAKTLFQKTSDQHKSGVVAASTCFVRRWNCRLKTAADRGRESAGDR